jgi:hypothetical protein
MKFLKQSTQAIVPMGPFLNPADGVTLVTSLVSALDHATTGIFCLKNGGGGAIRHQSIAAATVYDAYGMYLVTLDATDTGTLGRLRIYFAAAVSCLPVWEDFQVLPAAIFDSLVTGSGGAIPNVTSGGNGGLPTTNGTKLNQTADLTAGQSIAAASVPATVATDAHVLLIPTNPYTGTPPSASDIATAVWGATTRTLSSFGTLVADIATAVWGATTRTLSSFGTLVADIATAVWGATTRTLSSAGALVADIWAYTTRVLTAGTNIVLAKGAGITGLNDLDAAGVTAAVPTKEAIADQVWDEASSGHLATGSTGARLAAVAIPLGAGAIAWSYTLTNSADGIPLADADIWITTDLAGLNVIASGRTDAYGVVRFNLDAGTVYVWRQKTGWDFVNPRPEIVS